MDCSPFEGECVALKFHSEGYHSAVLTYSTEASAPGKSAFPQPLYDLAKSISLLRGHAEEWNIDPDKIVILGFSAGANLCGLYGNLWNSPVLKTAGKPELLQPNALVLCYPMLDLRYHLRMLENNKNENVGLQDITGERDKYLELIDFWKQVNYAQMGVPVPTKQQIWDNSPVWHINKDTPPTFIWHTFEDKLLSPVQSLEYAKALYENNIPCELHIYQKGKHGLSLADKTSAKKREDIDEHIATWMTLVQKWLASQFGDDFDI